jgi:hypothetical protein
MSRTAESLHLPHRRLIELRIEHADLDAMATRLALEPGHDELLLRRLKKRKLLLKDAISKLEQLLSPKEPA